MADLLSTAATAALVASTKPVFLHSVVLTPAAAVSTAVVRSGGASGTVLVTLQAAANGGSVEWVAGSDPGVASAGVHVTLTGTGALASCEITGI